MRTKTTLGTAGLAITLFSGAALTTAPTASAETPCISNNTSCNSARPLSQNELKCYKDGAWGGLAGLLTGNAAGALAGAAVGCVRGATGN